MPGKALHDKQLSVKLRNALKYWKSLRFTEHPEAHKNHSWLKITPLTYAEITFKVLLLLIVTFI